MKNIEKLVIVFHGHSEIDKNDIVITEIDDKSGNMIPVNPKELTTNEIIRGINEGIYYVSFEETYAKTLDGEIKIDVEKEE